MPVCADFASKSPEQIADDLLGYEPSCVDAALRFRESGAFEDFIAMIPGIIAFHLPRSAPRPPAVLADEMRLVQDLGLDSLALTEMAFVLGDLFHLAIDTREVFGVVTVGDLKAFLKGKIEAR
jgi:acyl carrier protein